MAIATTNEECALWRDEDICNERQCERVSLHEMLLTPGQSTVINEATLGGQLFPAHEMSQGRTMGTIKELKKYYEDDGIQDNS